MRFIENVFTDDTISDWDTVIYSLINDIPVINIYVIVFDEVSKKQK